MTAPAPSPTTVPTDPVFDRLLAQRVIVLGAEIDDELANRVVGQLLLLAAEDRRRDITLYVNSPGGSVTAGFAIHDAMQLVEPDVATVAIGLAASMGQFLLTAGAPGKRSVLPHAEVMMHQPHGGLGGSASDVVIRAGMLGRLKRRIAEITAERSGRDVEQVTADADRDRWFSAQEAVDYGLADRILHRL